MPVSSVVVTCIQGTAESVAGVIGAIDGVEVHGVLPEGQVVAVIEADTVQGEVDPVSRMARVGAGRTVRGGLS